MSRYVEDADEMTGMHVSGVRRSAKEQNWAAAGRCCDCCETEDGLSELRRFWTKEEASDGALTCSC